MADRAASETALQQEEAESVSELRPIGAVSRMLGMTPRAIRYYQELGLLRPAVRVKGSDRLFDASDIQRLEEIKRLREVIGFSLAEIATLLESDDLRAQLRSRFHGTADPDERRLMIAEARGLAKQRLELFERKLEQVAALRDAEIERLAVLDRLGASEGDATQAD